MKMHFYMKTQNDKPIKMNFRNHLHIVYPMKIDFYMKT